MTEPASSQICAAWAALADLPAERPALDDAEWTDLLLVASEILWALSARQWSGDGGCEATAVLRVDATGCRGWWPVASPTWFFGEGATRFFPRSPVTTRRGIKLPHDEVTEVVSVTTDAGPFAEFELRGSWLFRTDSRGWDEFDSDVTVSYLWGSAPPEAGRRYAAVYALELGKAVAGDGTCRLPKRVVSVTRQGISMSLIDPQRYLDKGRLGMPDIDQWLASVNPSSVPERASVWSPDVLRADATP